MIYRNTAKARIFVIVGVYGVLMILALVALSSPGAVDALELVAGLGLSLWSIFRLSRCGVYEESGGIRVVNPLSSTRLHWLEIRRFVLPERGPCLVERLDGTSLKVFAIQRSPFGRARAEAALVEALNARLPAESTPRANSAAVS